MGDRFAGGEEARETKRRASEARQVEEHRYVKPQRKMNRGAQRRLTEQRRAIVPALHVYLAPTPFLQSIF